MPATRSTTSTPRLTAEVDFVLQSVLQTEYKLSWDKKERLWSVAGGDSESWDSYGVLSEAEGTSLHERTVDWWVGQVLDAAEEHRSYCDGKVDRAFAALVKEHGRLVISESLYDGKLQMIDQWDRLLRWLRKLGIDERYPHWVAYRLHYRLWVSIRSRWTEVLDCESPAYEGGAEVDHGDK